MEFIEASRIIAHNNISIHICPDQKFRDENNGTIGSQQILHHRLNWNCENIFFYSLSVFFLRYNKFHKHYCDCSVFTVGMTGWCSVCRKFALNLTYFRFSSFEKFSPYIYSRLTIQMRTMQMCWRCLRFLQCCQRLLSACWNQILQI